MLLRLTNRCNENCKHCMISATPNGDHMTIETLENAMRLIAHYDPISLVITGGDPFLMEDLHKYLLVIMKYIQRRKTKVILESNGWWIDNPRMVEKVRGILAMPKVFGLQISTDKRFYPNYERTMKNKAKFEALSKKITFVHDMFDPETGVGHLHYQGRAQEFMTEEDIKHLPSCCNLLSWAKNYDRIPYVKSQGAKRIIECLEYRGKFCTPAIDVDGSIRVGESSKCQSIFNVNDIPKYNNLLDVDWVILSNLRSCKFCDQCKEAKNVDPAKRLILGL